MGFFIRKTKKMGLFNFNLSKSGIGTSVGAMGIRTGIDSKGRVYISGGKGMFRFRKYLSNKTATKMNDVINSNKEIKTVKSKYKPTLLNSFQSKGIGYIITFFKGSISTILSLTLLSICWSYMPNIADTHPGWALFLFFLGLALVYLPFEYLYRPKFVRVADEAIKYYNKNDYENSINLLLQIQELVQNSKHYEMKYEFSRWFYDTLYDCYIQLEQYNEALELLDNNRMYDHNDKMIALCTKLEKWEKLKDFLIENRDIINGSREILLRCYEKLEDWENIISILQKEYTQEEKEEHPSFYAVLAEAFIKIGKPDIALETILQGPINARKMSKEMCLYRYGLAKCYEAVGNIENAKKQYSKIYAYDADFEDVKEKLEQL